MNFKRKAYCFLIGFFCFNLSSISAQNQRIADSLKIIYLEDKLGGDEKLELLKNLAFNESNDYKLALKYAEELVALSALSDNREYLYNGYLQKGFKHKILGDLENALTAFFKSAKIAIDEENISLEGSAYMAVGDVYNTMGNRSNSENYYNKAIYLLRTSKNTNDSIALASALLNAGDSYFNNKKYDIALQNFEESGLIFKKINYLVGTAYNLGNVGMVYAEQGKDALAEENINEAITILEELEDYYPISVYLTFMADIYFRKNELTTAFSYAQRSLELSERYGLKEQISEANLKLSELYNQVGDQVTSYKYYKDHIVYRDSVKNIEAVQQMADQRTNYEVSQKQIEVDLLDQKQKNQRIVVIATAIALFLIGLLAAGLYRRNRFIRKTKQIIEVERDRSDKLLLNILPEETAQELKLNGIVQAKHFDSVTVLFTDFKGFTQYSEKLSPAALVETIGFYFSKFDEIIERHGLEKIKTIGDSYMCAGGLPFPTEDHAHKMVTAAFEIVEFVKETKENDAASELTFDIRIGINTGPVVAGVVGTKKFAYDIWGDTVNVASRMESMSDAGMINISHSTYELIKSDFDCEYRGEIEAKNRGKVKMYFVNGIKIGSNEKAVIKN